MIVSERWATFDCFGTLVDWHTGFRQLFEPLVNGRAAELEAAYHTFEGRIERGDFRRYADVTAQATKAAVELLGLDIGADNYAILARHWGSLPLFSETRRELLALREAGWRIGILTNCDIAMFDETKSTLGVPLDLVITAEEVRSYKPGLAHFTTFRERVQPETWVHVACSWYHDIAPARELGVARVWIDRDKTGNDPAAATLVQPALDSLPDVVERAARRHRESNGNTV